jgi:hypothetical protein
MQQAYAKQAKAWLAMRLGHLNPNLLSRKHAQRMGVPYSCPGRKEWVSLIPVQVDGRIQCQPGSSEFRQTLRSLDFDQMVEQECDPGDGKVGSLSGMVI